MKCSFAWMILVILAFTIATFGVVMERVSRAQVPPTTNSSTGSKSDGEYLHWESLGGPYERVAYGLAIDTAKEWLYVGTWGHGVYRSKDNGDSWHKRGSDEGRYIRVLATLPSDSKILYAGTYGQGIYRSVNRSGVWEQLGQVSAFTDLPSPTRSPLRIESILIVEDAGTERIFAGTHNGVWTSSDLGDTWKEVNDGFADSDDAYNVQALAHNSAGYLYAGTLAGLYSRQNSDKPWRYLEPPDDFPGRIFSLAVVTDTTNITGTLLIGTDGAGIYALDIETQEWLTRTIVFTDDERAQTIQVLLSAPGGVVYAGTVDFGVYESRDGGQNWQHRVNGLPSNSRSILSLAQNPTNGTLYAGTYGDGVYRLAAEEQEWEPANNDLPVDFPVQKIVFSGPDSKQLLAALQVGGIYLNTNRSEETPTWSRMPQALSIGPTRDVIGMAVSGSDRNTIVIAGRAGIFRSIDGGKNWDHLGCMECESGLPKGVEAKALTQGRQNLDILYAALTDENMLYHSVDAGATWQPVPAKLDEDNEINARLLGSITGLTIGAEDEIVYLGLDSGQVFVTNNAGLTWRELKQVGEQPILELDWTERTLWDVFLHGGQQKALYARTKDGVYVSYDEGQTWQLRLRGFFNALLADPHRPWVVYVASPATVLDKEFEFDKPLPLTPDLWISYNEGETWQWAGRGPTLAANTSPASFTTLAFDPNDPNRLYAGTEGTGIFRAKLIFERRPLTQTAVAVFLVSFLILSGFIYVIQTGLSLGRRYRLPPYAWPKLAYLRLRHRTELGWITSEPTPLPALGRLVLALAPITPFSQQTIQQSLEDADISIIPARLENSLNGLIIDYHFLEQKEGAYQLASPLFGKIAQAAFWQNETKRQELIETVRNESLFRNEIQHFLDLSGFITFPFDVGFKVSSRRPEYALLGAEQGIYVHLYPGSELDEQQMLKAREIAKRAYNGQLASKVAILAVNEPPQSEIYELIGRWRQESDFRLVILSQSELGDPDSKEKARRQLNMFLRRGLGNENLIALAN